MGSESSKDNDEFKDNSLINSEDDELSCHGKKNNSPEEEGYLDVMKKEIVFM